MDNMPLTIGFKQGNGAKAGGIGAQEEISPTLYAAGSGTNQVPALMCGNPWDSQSERVYQGDGAWHSLSANETGGQSRDAVLAVDVWNQSVDGEVAASVTAAVGGSNTSGPKVLAVDTRNGTENESVNGTLQAKESGGTSLNCNIVVRTSE